MNNQSTPFYNFMRAAILFACLVIPALTFAQRTQEDRRSDKPYVVHERSMLVSKVLITKDDRGADDVVQVSISNATGGAGRMSGAQLPPADINGISLVTGNYTSMRHTAKNSRGMTVQLMDATFPLRVRANFGDQYVDFEVKEKGFWKVAVTLNQ